jgi:transcriptional regulator with XRE-family HTH domain
MNFKDHLRGLRQKAKLTQEELATKAGMPVVTLRGLEQGQRLPSWPTVVRLARALTISTDALIADDVLAFEKKSAAKPKRPARKPREKT